MIAATRDTSTRSTPTPIAVTARRSEAEARREPCGGGQVAAQHQSEPYQRHAERRPQRDQRPKRRPPARNRVDLVGPATVLVGNLRLEREPRGLETARGGAERLLPLRVRRLVENAGLAHARGDRVERVESASRMSSSGTHGSSRRRGTSTRPSDGASSGTRSGMGIFTDALIARGGRPDPYGLRTGPRNTAATREESGPGRGPSPRSRARSRTARLRPRAAHPSPDTTRGVARPGRADTPPRDGRCAPTPHTPAARGWSPRSRGPQRASPLRRGGGTSRVARVAPSTPTRRRPDCRRPVETLAAAAPDRAS